MNLLWQNSLFLVLSVSFPVIKSDVGVHRKYISIPVLFYISGLISYSTVSNSKALSEYEVIWWVSIHHLLCAHLSPEKGYCSATRAAAAHTTHPHCWWGVLWLAVTTAGQGPGNGCPFPILWEEETFCQHLNSSFPLNLRYYLPADRNIFINRFTRWVDQKECEQILQDNASIAAQNCLKWTLKMFKYLE